MKILSVLFAIQHSRALEVRRRTDSRNAWPSSDSQQRPPAAAPSSDLGIHNGNRVADQVNSVPE